MSLAIEKLPAEALTAALECVPTPVFLLRPNGEIVHVNDAGNEFLRGNQALRRTQSGLVARRSSEAKILTAVMARVGISQRPELVRLLSRNGNVSLLMTVTPVPGHQLMIACAVNLHAEGPRLARWLQAAFAFSPQNADLAEGLMSGLSLLDFASKHNVTLGASRTRLKKLFAQTGTNSQAALVSTLLRAAMIAPGRSG